MIDKISKASLLALAVTLLLPTSTHAATDFLYTFNSPGTLVEAGSMGESSSPYFYLNSGGKFTIKNGIGSTIKNDLLVNDVTRLLYSTANALDTDGGSNPQNLFRLLTKETWQNANTKLSFRITDQNLSDSPNRDGHNGVLIMNRYQDQDNLYYAGVRNDGEAIIKKKIGGKYHTLASVQIFGTEGQYDRESAPSMLPLNRWTGLKTEVYNLSNGAVRIRLLLDRENDGSYVSILAADDNGVGGAPFLKDGHAGIRTDFMDVEFDNFRITAR